MAAFQNFRGAFNGFNREDVVRYIEFINNQHAAEVNQLNTQLQAMGEELEALRGQGSAAEQLRAALEKIEALEQELDQVRPRTEAELEAYRRAERAERVANERVAQMYAQASGILADATACTDETATQVGQLTEQICDQLAQLQVALNAGSNTIRETAAAMYAIKPVSEEE